MIRRAIRIIKDKVFLYKEHNKDDRAFAVMLHRSIKENIESTYDELNNKRNILKLLVEKSSETKVEDKFLITKSNEAIEKANKLLKKADRMKDQKVGEHIVFKDMYNMYCFTNDMGKLLESIKEYIHQFNRHSLS